MRVVVEEANDAHTNRLEQFERVLLELRIFHLEFGFQDRAHPLRAGEREAMLLERVSEPDSHARFVPACDIHDADVGVSKLLYEAEGADDGDIMDLILVGEEPIEPELVDRVGKFLDHHLRRVDGIEAIFLMQAPNRLFCAVADILQGHLAHGLSEPGDVCLQDEFAQDGQGPVSIVHQETVHVQTEHRRVAVRPVRGCMLADQPHHVMNIDDRMALGGSFHLVLACGF